MGMPVACSAASLTSAVTTGPQVTLSRNGRHSTTGPAALACCGSGIRSALETMRRPSEPVSSKMPSIVWQVDEPGTHTVTLTKGWLKALFVGPPLTTTGTALPVEFESHCLDDTCAIRSSAPTISRRGTGYLTTAASTPTGRSCGTYAMPAIA